LVRRAAQTWECHNGGASDRAINAARFGALADPFLELHNADGDVIAMNDNWGMTLMLLRLKRLTWRPRRFGGGHPREPARRAHRDRNG
jgi:hypothetical protein